MGEKPTKRAIIKEYQGSCGKTYDFRSLKTEYDDEERFMTAHEVAEFLRIPYQSVLNMTSAGQLPYFKLGGRNRYLKNELRELLLGNRRGSSYGN